MADTIFDRCIAMASLCQSIKLVQDVACTGSCDQEAMTTCLKSLIVTDSNSTIDIFENESKLNIGLKTLVKEFDNPPKNGDLTRYLINILTLERKLSARRDTLSQLGDRISTLKRQTLHFDLLDEQMIANMASVYLDVISPLGPRIQVSGKTEYLQKTLVQQQVRALLLCSIRSAVLWRQVGGKRRHLIFSRKSLIEQAKLILARQH